MSYLANLAAASSWEEPIVRADLAEAPPGPDALVGMSWDELDGHRMEVNELIARGYRTEVADLLVRAHLGVVDEQLTALAASVVTCARVTDALGGP